MTESILQFAVSNSLAALLLAIIATVVHVSGKRPFISHLLWVLVLVKLITPPMVIFSVDSVPGLTNFVSQSINIKPKSNLTVYAEVGEVASPVNPSNTTALLRSEETTIQIASGVSPLNLITKETNTLLIFWIFSSTCLLIWSLLRILRFNRFLRMSSTIACLEIQTAATDLAALLSLRKVPEIYTTTARISPMVWWIGGEVRIVIPADLSNELDANQLRWILAHELGHVKRRDHIVRWLEWFTTVCFWWNPIAWWARRNLRISEEICCDALVLATLEAKPHSYAIALLSVIDFLASAVIRPPAMASGINSGGILERRFKMIISDNRPNKTPLWVSAVILIAGAVFIPFGMDFVEAAAEENANGAQQQTSLAQKQNDCSDSSSSFDYLTDQVHSGELSGKQGLLEWEKLCGDYDGPEVHGMPTSVAQHLWMMANNNNHEMHEYQTHMDHMDHRMNHMNHGDMKNHGQVSTEAMNKVKELFSANGNVCGMKSLAYQHLTHSVHSGELTAKEGFAKWQHDCGDFHGNHSWAVGMPLSVPQHLWMMSQND